MTDKFAQIKARAAATPPGRRIFRDGAVEAGDRKVLTARVLRGNTPFSPARAVLDWDSAERRLLETARDDLLHLSDALEEKDKVIRAIRELALASDALENFHSILCLCNKALRLDGAAEGADELGLEVRYGT